MSAENATFVELTWEGNLVFRAVSGGNSLVLDSAERAGPSPVQVLAAALAGCMAMDIVHILLKGRATIGAMAIRLDARRAVEAPRRVVSVEARFALETDASEAKVTRALDLSREKYCSVWHSMRQDIPLVTSLEVRRLTS